MELNTLITTDGHPLTKSRWAAYWLSKPLISAHLVCIVLYNENKIMFYCISF